MLLLACGPTTGSDAGPGIDGSGADGSTDVTIWSEPAICGVSPGCPCTDPGLASCEVVSPMGIECCGGVWRTFTDGPCWRLDGGVPPCDGSPIPGCTCATEGETACRPFAWRLVCRSGTWSEEVGRVCC